jgi:methane/ammonia monooxygenase subunit C
MALSAVRSLSLENPVVETDQVKVWNPLPLVAMVGIVLAICGAWRWYQQVEGFASGLDASEPAFADKWMPLWYLNITVLGLAQVFVPLYLWLTRDRALAKLTPEIELKRYFLFFTIAITWMLIQSIAMMFGATDAAWHQVVVRDTSLTPSHIVLFFGTAPLGTVFALAAFFYAVTRIPDFSRTISLALLIAVLAPAVTLPSVAYNEWGHAYWLMEELFIAPLHWGFVMLAWCLLAFLGVIGQSLPRLAELTRLTNAHAAAR